MEENTGSAWKTWTVFFVPLVTPPVFTTEEQSVSKREPRAINKNDAY